MIISIQGSALVSISQYLEDHNASPIFESRQILLITNFFELHHLPLLPMAASTKSAQDTILALDSRFQGQPSSFKLMRRLAEYHPQTQRSFPGCCQNRTLADQTIRKSYSSAPHRVQQRNCIDITSRRQPQKRISCPNHF
jgi:hypothetical protein